MLWEKAGQPNGADFSDAARKALQAQLDKGATIKHLEKSLKAPSPKEPEPVAAKAALEPSQDRRAPPPGRSMMPKQEEPEVGFRLGWVIFHI